MDIQVTLWQVNVVASEHTSCNNAPCPTLCQVDGIDMLGDVVRSHSQSLAAHSSSKPATLLRIAEALSVKQT